ncbi:FAD:protein FMN transferase [Microbacterium oxydans]|uniref:FAD:protein FMN transferase n=1 Tax=Microbacterium oxydans TaxID=82380 RepID=A0A3S9WIN8_9MICO|nr:MULTISPECIES: FAD:protein FMN transferase [Microbacterium]AZS39873.1 FAD:protein FMN transferase [Microbacterium oxydans]KAB1889301.1 FAD:protein FMN transferase [Microbacterium oxydans]MBE7956126.1 FAD:protein FMN transferase [Microbacterium sp. R1]MCB8043386.1 FAD:protein FMN transferase [Microbacterium oxydans]NYF28755.1 thiamine biosynthesis lipoprotein [Microbacterium sp. JAI119]
MATWSFEAIGTHWEIETTDPLPAAAKAAVTAEIERFDREWSRFRADSEVVRLGRLGGVLASADAAPMLDAYRELSAATAGAVNPLVAASLDALGYDAAYTLIAGQPLPAPEEWDRHLSWDGGEVRASAPALLDVGALGKGRLVDLVSTVLERVPGDLVIDAGGDIRVRGAGVRIALEHPYDATKAIGVIEVKDQALCASAINRRAWGSGLHHVLDARTGTPVRTWAATWAVAPHAMRADAVATALFFDGGPEIAAAWGTEWVRMSTDGRVQRSPGFPAELFLTVQNQGRVES